MTESNDTINRATSSQNAAAAGSWQASAKTTTGNSVSEITAQTLVTIDGIEATADFFHKQGYLTKAADGSYVQGSGPHAAPQAPQGDILTPPDDVMAMVNAALEPLPQADLDQVTAHAIGVATGNLTDESLTQLFAQRAGVSLADAHQRMSAVKASYQAQANHALITRSGVGPQDIPAFYAWAKENANGQLRDAMQSQLYSNDVSKYAKLADQWQSITAPSVAALQAAGIETRTSGYGVMEVKVQGQWLTPKAAAKAGLL